MLEPAAAAIAFTPTPRIPRRKNSLLAVLRIRSRTRALTHVVLATSASAPSSAVYMPLYPFVAREVGGIPNAPGSSIADDRGAKASPNRGAEQVSAPGRIS